jgi:hypothetical protein
MAISIGKSGMRITGDAGEIVSPVNTPAGFVIDIIGTEQEIIARTGDPIGTIAFATDTNDIMILNTNGFDKWGSVEDTP